MAAIFDEIKEGFRDGVAILVKKTDEWTKLGKLNVEIIGIKREIEKMFAELGGRAFELLSQNPKNKIGDDEEVKRIVTKLEELEQKLEEKKKASETYKNKKTAPVKK